LSLREIVMAEQSSGDVRDQQDVAVVFGREFSAAVVLFNEAVGRQLGLSGTERKILDVLDRLGPVTAGRLAEHSGLTTGAITGIVDRLARAGFVGREPNPDDRRSVIIQVLPSSDLDRLRDHVFGPFGRSMADVSAGYTPAELATITGYLRRVTEVLHEHTARLNAGG
jgi:DNA-binding MarR family transcriptional regulator